MSQHQAVLKHGALSPSGPFTVASFTLSFPTQLACDKRMSDKEDDLMTARQELKVVEAKNLEEMAKLNEEKMRAEDKLNQFKKDRDDIVDQLGALIKKKDQKIKELEERVK